MLFLMMITFTITNINGDPRSFLTTVQLAEEAGYASETHTAETKDGYLLTVHRLLPRNTTGGIPSSAPVLLMHGLFGASDSWLIAGPGNALGFVLADQGFDVWLGNFRGNYYSRKHVSLKPSDPQFWRFSWQEMGEFDLPAIQETILFNSKLKSIYYIGHSTAAAAFCVFCASDSQQQSCTNFRMAILLAPAVVPSDPMPPFRVPVSPEIQKHLEKNGPFELLQRTHLIVKLINNFCDQKSKLHSLCMRIFSLLFREDPKLIDESMLAFYLSHLISGASMYTTLHFSQLLASQKFRRYDYGPEENLKKYNQTVPPSFDFRRITVPVAIYYATNDIAVSYEDARKVYEWMPSKIGLFKVPNEKFSHIDFLIGKNVKKVIYDMLINIMLCY